MIDTKDEKSALKQNILITLRKGHDNAITGEVLSQRLHERGTRAIRLVMRELISEGYCIIGANSKPYGYFIADTQEEVDEYRAELRSYLCEHALRRRDIKRAWDKELERRRVKLQEDNIPPHQIGFSLLIGERI